MIIKTLLQNSCLKTFVLKKICLKRGFKNLLKKFIKKACPWAILKPGRALRIYNTSRARNVLGSDVFEIAH